ncbi:hypothetical protein L3H48_11035, partial [Corynebacterium sp. MC-05]|uniref:hypothetical protein n=1 Tax=Corynebacterium parakroppenstedtii TaxID=2828363 RepID=UPI001F246BD8
PANACDIKTCIQMIQQSVQFGGNATEDPNAHISNFLEVCGTFNYNRASEEAMRLRVFPYSLKDRAKASFVINVDGQEVVLTLANKPQLGQDTDMEQNSRDSNTSSTDKGLDFGQQAV